MILDNGLFAALFISLLGHALVLWSSFFFSTRSQFSDYEQIRLAIYTGKLRVEAEQLTSSLLEFVSIDLGTKPPRQVRQLFFCQLTIVPLLRVLALAPGFFFGIALLFYLVAITNFRLFSEDVNVVVLCNVLLGFGFACQLAYFGLKLRAGIVGHLQAQHPRYSSASPVAVLLDVYPTVSGYASSK